MSAPPYIPTLDPRFRPTTKQVGVFIKNRTVDRNNNYVGDFTPDTVVTDLEVNMLIDLAGPMVLSSLRWTEDPEPSIPDENFPTVIALVALLAACFVEVTKFSEQIARQVSPYPQLKQMFDDMLKQKQSELGIADTTGGNHVTIPDLIALGSGTATLYFPENLTPSVWIEAVNWDTEL
jgi:hypothetical protein